MRSPQKEDKIFYSGHEISFALIKTPYGERPLVYYPEAAGIIAMEEDKIIFVEQFRYGANSLSLEIPAGKKDPHEDILSCAKREFQEETGYGANSWEFLFSYYPAISLMTEKMSLFLAKGLFYVGQKPDQDEEIEVKKISFPEAWDLFLKGKIIDSKTIIALQFLALNPKYLKP